jgi:hypothetical protein
VGGNEAEPQLLQDYLIVAARRLPDKIALVSEARVLGEARGDRGAAPAGPPAR